MLSPPANMEVCSWPWLPATCLPIPTFRLCWIKFALIDGAELGEIKRKKETRGGKMYGWMHDVCADRDNLHSHQLLDLRTPPSILHPCSGFPGSTLFARNVTVAKSSLGAAMRTRHHRCRAARLADVRVPLKVGAYRAFIAKMLRNQLSASRGCFALNTFWCHVWFQGNCWSFQHVGCVFDYRMNGLNVPAGHQSYRNSSGFRHLRNNGSSPISMWLQWKPRFQRKLILTSHSFWLTRSSASISRKTILTGKLVWVWMELVITIMVGSNVSLKMKGRNTLLTLRGKPELMKTPFIQAVQPPVRTGQLCSSSGSKGHICLSNKKNSSIRKLSKQYYYYNTTATLKDLN